MKILSDGFVWKLVDYDTAKKIWEQDLFPLYILYHDESETLVECEEQLEEGIEFGLQFGIEVGNLSDFGKLAPSAIELIKSIIPPIKWENNGVHIYGESELTTFIITGGPRRELFANGKHLGYHSCTDRAKEAAERYNFERIIKLIGIKI